jgi:hypothetical protein
MTEIYKEIASYTFTSAGSTVTIPIPQNYEHLKIVTRTLNTGSTNSIALIRFNGDSGSNYSFTRLYASGTTGVSDRFANQVGLEFIFDCGTNNNGFNTSVWTIPQYSSSSTFKNVIGSWETIAGTTNRYIVNQIGLWRNTSAIRSITFTRGTAVNFTAGSTISIYGIASISSFNPIPGVVASGGDEVFITEESLTPSKYSGGHNSNALQLLNIACVLEINPLVSNKGIFLKETEETKQELALKHLEVHSVPLIHSTPVTFCKISAIPDIEVSPKISISSSKSFLAVGALEPIAIVVSCLPLMRIDNQGFHPTG